MTQEQTIEMITAEALPERVQAMQTSGHRLVQISATALPDRHELTYSFDLLGKLTSLRVHLPPEVKSLISVSPAFGAAALYENEIHDLFGLEFRGMTIDFHGHLYETAVKYPMANNMTIPKPPTAKTAVNPAAN